MPAPFFSVFLPVPMAVVGAAAVLGLLVGSFLNVVIYRLPRMLERAWAEEIAHSQGQPLPEQPAWNLWVPASHCPHCQQPVPWYDNLPLLSYLKLKGRCGHCRQAVHWRYPVVESLNALWWALMAWRYGWHPMALSHALLGSGLLALAWIDWETTWLPDQITQPLLWAGLLCATWGWSHASPAEAIGGAAAAYLLLWLVAKVFEYSTGQEGMGQGDWKLFAVLGAWFGWMALPALLLCAASTGTLAGLVLKMQHRLRENRYIPFGPFLALAGWWASCGGTEIFWQWLQTFSLAPPPFWA